MKRPKLGRRSVLRGAAVAGAAALAPTIWSRRTAAATAGFGRAQHVLVLYARGGLRSHCLFNAVGTEQHNPFGASLRPSGTEWTPGAVLGTADIETQAFGVVEGVHALTSTIAVLASVDLEPENPRPLIDHAPAVARLGTGVEGTAQGLLSRLMQLHPRYSSALGIDNLPPVDIGNTTFGRTDTEHVPLRIQGARSSRVQEPIDADWRSSLRAELNRGFVEHTPDAYAQRLTRLSDAKRNAFVFSGLLVDPRLDVIGAPEAEDWGASNAAMLEVLGNHDLVDRGDFESNPSWGPDVALALRLFGFGAPMVVVERDLYDTHSNEDQALPVRAADLGRQLAGVRFLLRSMEHPNGGSFWDRTVVTVVSEFNRNNTEANGYNSGLGSDHRMTAPEITRNQAIPLMGGPIEAAGLGGRRLGSTDAEMTPQGPVYSMRSLYSTLLDLLGASHEQAWPDPPVPDLYG